MSLLTNADKLSVVNQHIKSLDFQIYNTELDLIVANAESPVNSETVSGLNTRLTALNSKRALLEAEAAPLEAAVVTEE
jgi:hypothetical protein